MGEAQPDRSVERQYGPDSFPLPAQFTSFIGREREMAEVKRLLNSARLVTLTGAGGCGKTRLALRVASDLREAYADGVCWVDLAPLADPTLLPHAVAKALNTGERSGRALLDVVLDALHARCLLLVLDNCEHLALSCAELVHDVLCEAPHIRILATSREPLTVLGEMLFPVAPLALPPESQGTNIAAYDAVRLFVERAQGVLPGFNLNADNALAVAEICRRLDGIPLAIELASGRVNVLAVEQIAARLDDRFALLTTAQHGVPSHHSTLRAALDWSYTTLSTAEQSLLRRLSVFTGGCTLEAIEQVCAGEGLAAEQILQGLSSLVNKSLVVAETLQQREARYRMLETIRQYARDRLRELPEEQVMRDRHLDYFLQFAEKIEPRLHGPDQKTWLDSLDRDHDNLRAALEWSLGEGRVEQGLRLAAALTWFWELRTYWIEARRLVKTLLSQPEASPRTLVRAKALLAIATMAGWGGSNRPERPCAQELIAIAREHGAAGKRVLAYGLAAYSHMDFQEDPLGAIAITDEGLEVARWLDDEWLMAFLLMLRGWYLRLVKDFDAALSAMEESLEYFRAVGDPFFSMSISFTIGVVHLDKGDLAIARNQFEQILPIARELGDRRGIASLLGGLGDIERRRGRYDQAKRYYREFLEVAREIGEKSLIAASTINLAAVALHENDLNTARFFLAEDLAILRDFGPWQTKKAVHFIAILALAEKNTRCAIQLFAFSDGLFRQGRFWQGDVVERTRCLALARDQVDEETYSAAWAEGSALALEQAIAIAEQCTLAPSPSPASTMPHDPRALTPREIEVLRLVAAGLSDAQVAAQLVISRRTVSTHLTAIYGKLGVASRSAATRCALEQHLCS